MSCLYHLNQLKIPLAQDLIPVFPSIVETAHQTVDPESIRQLYGRDFSLANGSLVSHYLEKGDPAQLKVALGWLVKFIKRSQKTKEIPNWFQKIMLKNFWQAFERRPEAFLFLFNNENNGLRSVLANLVLTADFPRLKTLIQNLPPLTQSPAFDGLLHLSNELRLLESYPQIEQFLEEITLLHPKKIPSPLHTPLQRYFYKIAQTGSPEALAMQARGIELLNRNLLNFFEKKNEWRNYQPLTYPMSCYLHEHLIWSPFQQLLAQDLLKQAPDFISHFKEMPESNDYLQQGYFYVLAKAAGESFNRVSTPQQKEIVSKMETHPPQWLGRLEVRARAD